MRIYLHDEKTGGLMIAQCNQMGVDLLTPEIVRSRDSLPEGYNFFLDQVDALIIEITHPTRDIQFILAQAILAQKPALCLYAKNQSPRELLAHIKKRSAPRPLKTFSYTEVTLPIAINKFIKQHDPAQQEHQHVPSIKYTLRLTPYQEQYLAELSEERGMTKADLIRSIIQEKAEVSKRTEEGRDDVKFDN